MFTVVSNAMGEIAGGPIILLPTVCIVAFVIRLGPCATWVMGAKILEIHNCTGDKDCWYCRQKAYSPLSHVVKKKSHLVKRHGEVVKGVGKLVKGASKVVNGCSNVVNEGS